MAKSGLDELDVRAVADQKRRSWRVISSDNPAVLAAFLNHPTFGPPPYARVTSSAFPSSVVKIKPPVRGLAAK
jgi:hypothetical protein